jgi:hypothetical protein
MNCCWVCWWISVFKLFKASIDSTCYCSIKATIFFSLCSFCTSLSSIILNYCWRGIDFIVAWKESPFSSFYLKNSKKFLNDLNGCPCSISICANWVELIIESLLAGFTDLSLLWNWVSTWLTQWVLWVWTPFLWLGLLKLKVEIVLRKSRVGLLEEPATESILDGWTSGFYFSPS